MSHRFVQLGGASPHLDRARAVVQSARSAAGRTRGFAPYRFRLRGGHGFDSTLHQSLGCNDSNLFHDPKIDVQTNAGRKHVLRQQFSPPSREFFNLTQGQRSLSIVCHLWSFPGLALASPVKKPAASLQTSERPANTYLRP
ncbi:MAG TPA: hypothetical protein VMF30_05890, partial [Pirellulales bacterium]|nr:hypothetical protein [Pirellulales bacterium]